MGKGTASRRGEVKALGRARGQEAGDRPKRTYERHVTGLDWLRDRSKISARQYEAGRRYGMAWRASAMEGVASIKSCLNVGVGGGDAPTFNTDAEATAWVIERRRELVAAQAMLLGHEGAIAALDLVCGRQLTPREALGAAAPESTIADTISSLRFALELLVRHWWPTPTAKVSQ